MKKLLIALTVMFLFCSSTRVHAEAQEKAERWQAYINGRFGYSVHYPAIFDNRKDPDNGDGIWLTSKSKKYALTISGGYNVLGYDGASKLASRLENTANIVPGSDESDETWYRVIYGDKHLFHEYGIIDDENWASFILSYPKNEKARFTPIISQMEESLSLTK